jgi:hypothetical protein
MIAANRLRDRAHQIVMPKLGRLGAAEGGRRASRRRRREKQRDVWRRTDPPVRRTVDVATTCVFRRFCFFFLSAFRIRFDREVQNELRRPRAVYRNNCTRSKTRVQSLSKRVNRRVLTGPTVGSEVCTSSQANPRDEWGAYGDTENER